MGNFEYGIKELKNVYEGKNLMFMKNEMDVMGFEPQSIVQNANHYLLEVT